MADVRVMKRGKVYQYQFEIAPVDGKRKYIKKNWKMHCEWMYISVL